jgi:hypothetical protein
MVDTVCWNMTQCQMPKLWMFQRTLLHPIFKVGATLFAIWYDVGLQASLTTLWKTIIMYDEYSSCFHIGYYFKGQGNVCCISSWNLIYKLHEKCNSKSTSGTEIVLDKQKIAFFIFHTVTMLTYSTQFPVHW